MSLATFALLIAFWEFLIGVPLLIVPKATSAWLTRVVQDDVLYRVVGAAFFMLCMLPLVGGAAITPDLEGLIRLLAWWGAIKSLSICWFAHRLSHVSVRLLKHEPTQRLFGALAVAAGCLILWAAILLRAQP